MKIVNLSLDVRRRLGSLFLFLYYNLIIIYILFLQKKWFNFPLIRGVAVLLILIRSL